MYLCWNEGLECVLALQRMSKFNYSWDVRDEDTVVVTPRCRCEYIADAFSQQSPHRPMCVGSPARVQSFILHLASSIVHGKNDHEASLPKKKGRPVKHQIGKHPARGILV